MESRLEELAKRYLFWEKAEEKNVKQAVDNASSCNSCSGCSNSGCKGCSSSW